MKNEGESKVEVGVRSVVDHAARTHTEQREVPGPTSHVPGPVPGPQLGIPYVHSKLRSITLVATKVHVITWTCHTIELV